METKTHILIFWLHGMKNKEAKGKKVELVNKMGVNLCSPYSKIPEEHRLKLNPEVKSVK